MTPGSRRLLSRLPCCSSARDWWLWESSSVAGNVAIWLLLKERKESAHSTSFQAGLRSRLFLFSHHRDKRSRRPEWYSARAASKARSSVTRIGGLLNLRDRS